MNPIPQNRISREDMVATMLAELVNMKPKLKDIVGADKHFVLDLAMDSLDLAEFFARVEQAFRFEFPDKDWHAITSIDKMATYILRDA